MLLNCIKIFLILLLIYNVNKIKNVVNNDRYYEKIKKDAIKSKEKLLAIEETIECLKGDLEEWRNTPKI